MRVRRHISLILAVVTAAGCAPSRSSSPKRGQIVQVPTAVAVVDASLPPSDDWEDEWHDRSPAPVEGTTTLYPVITWPGHSPPRYVGAYCGFESVPGAFFVVCTTDAVRAVDGGARWDHDFLRGAPARLASLEGEWPDNLLASRQTSDPTSSPYLDEDGEAWDDEAAKKKRAALDSFRPTAKAASGSSWMRYRRGVWSTIASTQPPRAWINKSALTLVVPPPEIAKSDPSGAKTKTKECADYSCLGIVPRFVTTEDAVVPDFSSLTGQVAWIHKGEDRDFAFAAVVDSASAPSVHFAMHAIDLKTKKKGYGIASWTSGAGAKFAWMPAPLDTAWGIKIKSASSKTAVRFEITEYRTGGSRDWIVEGNNSSWRITKAPEPPTISGPAASETYDDVWRREANGAISHRDPKVENGSWHIVPALEEPGSDLDRYARSIEHRGPGDTWIKTLGTIYHTVRPAETLHMTDIGGRLHPWPPPAKDDCKHPFLIYDAIEEDRGRPPEWQAFDDGSVLEMHLFGLVILGKPLDVMPDASTRDSERGSMRYMEGFESLIACVRPIRATVYHHPKRPEPPDP